MHIEPTSRCILECPGCPRTWFTNKFRRPFPKQDLDLDLLENFLSCDTGRNIDSFMLNGNHGDPIYYPDLLPMIDRFRDTKDFRISTNGSRMKDKFWEDLGSRMRQSDVIFFSIDGLEDTNHLYRKNSDWNSIMRGLKIMVQSNAKIVWKSIVFRTNQHQLNEMQDRANSLGVEFVSTITSRFGDDDLIPTDDALIDTDRIFDRLPPVVEIHPQCLSQEYISADGYYWPCCLMTSYFTLHSTRLYKERELWHIQGKTLSELRQRLLHWSQEIIDNPASAHPVCRMSCKPGQEFSWNKIR